MVHIEVTHVAIGFALLSAMISMGLLGFAIGALRQTGNRNLRFLVAAFAVFAIKSLAVAYGIWSGRIEHELLELVDGAGDLTAVLLIAFPFILARRSE